MRARSFLLLLLTVIACGRAGNGESDAETGVPRGTAAPESASAVHRYTTVMVQENCGFWVDCDYTVRAGLDRSPVILAVEFTERSAGTCAFSVTLSEAESRELARRADALRICSGANTPTADRGFDGLFVSLASGKEALVYKNRDGGQEEERINYLCGGRKAYYSYLKQLIVPRTPEECPDGYPRLFQ